MESFLSNAGSIMGVGVFVLLGAAFIKLWQQSRNEAGKDRQP